MSFQWTCPFCDRDTTITNTYETSEFYLKLSNSVGYRRFHSFLIVCPNPKCRKFTLSLRMFELERQEHVVGQVNWKEKEQLQLWNLIPPSSARVLPDYVPKSIVGDYNEACMIRDLSPKASATLSRRCLQGIIRDFWGVSKGRLVDEINAIKDRTDPLVWEAIEGVRKIGNIGAHMEKDINVIVDVDPGEAQLLIELIELLVKDWYVARHDREERLKAIIAAKEAKATAKKTTP